MIVKNWQPKCTSIDLKISLSKFLLEFTVLELIQIENNGRV